MRKSWRRAAVAAALSITGVLGGLVTAAPAQAEPVALTVAVDTDGTVSSVSGKATVHGTVTCNQPTPVNVSGSVFQVVKKVLVRGTFGARVDCTPGTAVAWTASATPNGTTPYGKGDAEVNAEANAWDDESYGYVTVYSTSIVTLAKS